MSQETFRMHIGAWGKGFVFTETMVLNHAEELKALRAEVKRLRREIRSLTPSLEILLRRRGFRVYKKEPSDDLFIPSVQFQKKFYEMLHKYSFRLFLRDVIQHQRSFTVDQLTRYSTARVIRSYIDYLIDIGLAAETRFGTFLTTKSIRSFGETLEWYVAQIFSREFGAETLWGVKFKRPKVGGDYDVLAKLNGALVAVEAKSSPPKQIYDSEIESFLARVEDLAPDFSIFLMDTELRMKDKLVPMFEKALLQRYAAPPAVLRIERELFEISGKIFIVNAKESVIQNIETVVSRFFRSMWL